MKSFLRLLLIPLLVALVLPSDAAAQDKKFTPGTYAIVPDANFSAGFDPTGLVVEFSATEMVATMQGQLMVKSKISLTGDIMTIEDLEGEVACPGMAKYKVSFTDKGMRMSPVEDPCAERGAVLSQITMVKK